MFKLFLLPFIIRPGTAQPPYTVPSSFVSEGLSPVRIVFHSCWSAAEISGIMLRFDSSRLVSLGNAAAPCRDLFIDSSGGVPGIENCERFSEHSVLFRFQYPLSASRQVYSLTLLLTLPSSEPNFWSLTFLDSHDTVSCPASEGLIVTPWITSNFDRVGDFRILSQSSDQINASSTMVFSLSWSGGPLDNSFVIDVVALPSDVWDMGALPGTPCAGYDQLSLGPGTFCKYMNFRGAVFPNQTNGFRISIAEISNSGQFIITGMNPSRGVNSVWVATLAASPAAGSSVIMSDAPVLVSGTVVGEIFDYSFPVAGAKQAVSLSFFPGNTLLSGGSIAVTPPAGFLVIDESPRSVEGRFSSVSGEWSVDASNNEWMLITDSPIFHDTLYAVKFFLTNPLAPQPAFAWTIMIKDAAGRIVSSSRNVRGLNIFGSLICGISPSSLLAGAVQTVTFSVKYGQSALSQSSSIRVHVPKGVDFVLGGCEEAFRMIDGPSWTSSSVSCAEGTFKVDFPIGTSILAGTSVIFSMQFRNPATSAMGRNEWKFETLLFDGSVQDWGIVDSFVIYPHNFQSLQVSPARRFSGSQQINLRFTPSQPVFTNDFLRFTAPAGFSWDTSSSTATIFHAQDNQLVLLVTGSSLAPGVAYSENFQINIPATSPKFANRWTIEHYRLLAMGGGEARRIQALSEEGFQTQSIVDISVTAYDMSANSWNNFAIILFTTTSSVEAGGYLEISATLPTLLCPARVLEGTEWFAIPLDISDRTHLGSSECTTREINGISFARLFVSKKIDANKKYQFVLSLLNPSSAPPADLNRFHLSTFSPSGVLIETGSVAGFQLNKPMVNSMYVASPNQDRRAGAINPTASFQIGFSEPSSPGSSFQIHAPFNVSLCPEGPGSACVVEQKFFNITSSCTCTLASRATVSLPVAVAPGSYGISISSVRNPISTPLWNYWKFFVIDSAGSIKQSAVWVAGYSIQNIFNVSIKGWNPANAVVGQTVVNPIELSFETSTSVPAGGLIEVTVPSGFVAPLDACSLFPTSINAGGVPSLPEGTVCSGDSKSTLKIFIPRPAPPGSYGIRFYVNNPTSPSISAGNWSIVSKSSAGFLIDAAYDIPGFPVVQRVDYFQVSPSSLTGNTSNTFLRIIFALSKSLSPKKSLSVSAPKGFSFMFARCGETNPNHLFLETSISGITALPDFVACTVNSSSVVVLTNTQPVRHGKPLPSSVPYVFYISNVQTPISTPEMNLWVIKADAEMGVGPGFKIQPKLTSVSVSSSNPGFGLSTLFTFIFTTVSPIDSGGTITITPPDSGYSFLPSSCGIPQTPSSCPFAFTACALNNGSEICSQYRLACASSELNLTPTRILYCTGSADSSIFTIETGKDVTIPAGTDLVFTVFGFNPKIFATGEGKWILETRNSFSGSVPVDRALVDSFPLFGVVHVGSLTPASQKVSASSNQVDISMYLSSPLPAPARIDVAFPRAFSDNIALIMKEVKLSGAFPAYCQWKLVVSSLSVRIDCPNDLVPSNRVLKMTLTISNPPITPSDNLWGVTGYSASSVVNVNLRIPGFSVYGDLDSADVTGRVLGPNSVNTVGISFTLASKLICDSTNPECFLNILFPRGYIPIDASCGSGIFSTTYSRYEGADSQFPLHSSFLSIPHGSFCSSELVNNSSLLMSVQIDSDLTSGIQYAFQVGVINPSVTPVKNVFAFATTVDGVELHRTETVPGLVMRELAVFEIHPSNPTKTQNNFIRFSIQSVKSIPPRSTISIGAPIGFVFTCNLMGFISLTSTTKCQSSRNLLYLTSDKSLTIGPNTLIQFTTDALNPHWTPQTNVWSIQISTSSGITVDVKTNAPGFDVTGILSASIAAPFTYVKQKTLLTISFAPSTVQSRAIHGNSIVLIGPSGYYFSSKCDGVSLRAISSNLANYPVPPSHVFPTSSLLCSGFENETVSIGFATGYALHIFNYELTIAVVNANKSSGNIQWTVLTRALNLISGTPHVLDYNASIPGYPLAEQITD